MTAMEDLPEGTAQAIQLDQLQKVAFPALDRPLPIRKRQRKPMKKSRVVEAEAESPVCAYGKPRHKPKTARKNTRPVVCVAYDTSV